MRYQPSQEQIDDTMPFCAGHVAQQLAKEIDPSPRKLTRAPGLIEQTGGDPSGLIIPSIRGCEMDRKPPRKPTGFIRGANPVGPRSSHPYGPWWILLLAAIGLGKLGGDVVRLIVEVFSAISSA